MMDVGELRYVDEAVEISLSSCERCEGGGGGDVTMPSDTTLCRWTLNDLPRPSSEMFE